MRQNILGLIVLALSLSACDANLQSVPEPSVSRTYSIINGTRVTDTSYRAVVALTLNYGRGYEAFCTGTLITPDWVLTAGHCVRHCSDDSPSEYIENTQSYQAVNIGNSESEFSRSNAYPIDRFIYHPNFVCSDTLIKNDIALLHLSKSVPLSVATPILPMPVIHDMTASEVNKGSVNITTVGFGKTDFNNDNSSGVKYKTNFDVYAYCPLKRTQSQNCGNSYYTSTDGFIYVDEANTNTCSGDSGGPSFWTRDGVEYVVGVTSFGYGDCDDMSGLTIVSDYYEDFIAKYVDDLAAEDPEDCTNGVDDNGDNRIDCQDPYCFSLKSCIPEDCTNGVDDNDDGLVDCEDTAVCGSEKTCQPEDCTNGEDDNANGLVDCLDPQCSTEIYCQPEDCTNGVDDNANGLVDCADSQCSAKIYCQVENCNNGVDDNGDGLVDCGDPECATASNCQKEICDNGVDDNGNGLVDCSDPECFGVLACQPEDCTNGVDDNGNGLMDCADPQCLAATNCQKEICDNGVDDNGNGLVDCNDPDCTETCSQWSASKDSGCSATPLRAHSSHALGVWIAFLSLGLLRRRRA